MDPENRENEIDPCRILFRSEGILAFDKPAGIPVHQGTGHSLGLAESLDGWARRNPGALDIQPGWSLAPLHRIDREASGVVLFGLGREAAAKIQKAFMEGKISKRYLAVIAGPLRPRGGIRGKVRSRLRGIYRYLPARLEYRLLAGDERLSLVEVHPGHRTSPRSAREEESGRTHLIRALFSSIDRPLAGDLRYGKPRPARQFLEKFGLSNLLLHAWELKLPPGILGPSISIRAPVPEEFRILAREKGWKVPEIEIGKTGS